MPPDPPSLTAHFTMISDLPKDSAQSTALVTVRLPAKMGCTSFRNLGWWTPFSKLLGPLVKCQWMPANLNIVLVLYTIQSSTGWNKGLWREGRLVYLERAIVSHACLPEAPPLLIFPRTWFWLRPCTQWRAKTFFQGGGANIWNFRILTFHQCNFPIAHFCTSLKFPNFPQKNEPGGLSPPLPPCRYATACTLLGIN